MAAAEQDEAEAEGEAEAAGEDDAAGDSMESIGCGAAGNGGGWTGSSDAPVEAAGDGDPQQRQKAEAARRTPQRRQEARAVQFFL